MKKLKLQFIVNVTIGCNSPESFKTDNEFINNDGIAMQSYLKEKIRESLTDSWQYAAQVEKVTIPSVKMV